MAVMQTFHYFPPGEEEQKSFLFQLLGTVLGLGFIAFLFTRAGDATTRAMLIGAGIGVVWLLARTVWALETKAQRSQNAEFGIDDDGLHITNPAGATQVVAWSEITHLEVIGGRLTVQWDGGQVSVGARELEDGMTLVREVMERYNKATGQGDASFKPPTNFIPLDPR
jgi:hypothetical protein